MQAPQLKRGLLGYTRRSVRQVLADRDRTLLRATEHARGAEARATELVSEVRALLEELDRQTGRLRGAEERSERQEGLLDLLRRELGAARRDYLRQNERARSAEARIQELDTELRSARTELESARRELESGLGSVVIELPDLDGDRSDLSTRGAPAP